MVTLIRKLRTISNITVAFSLEHDYGILQNIELIIIYLIQVSIEILWIGIHRH